MERNRSFNLPDLQNRFIEGGTSGTTHAAGLPDIDGNFGVQNDKFITYGGAFTVYANSQRYTNGIYAGDVAAGRLRFKASSANAIYGRSTTVQPTSMEMAFCIKY